MSRFGIFLHVGGSFGGFGVGLVSVGLGILILGRTFKKIVLDWRKIWSGHFMLHMCAGGGVKSQGLLQILRRSNNGAKFSNFHNFRNFPISKIY